MSPLILHRTILLLTLIKGAVISKPNIYWSKRAGGIGREPGQYQGEELSIQIEDIIKPFLQMKENKRFNKEYMENPLPAFSTTN